MINFIFLNLLAFLTAAVILKKVYNFSGFCDKVCGFSILFLAQVMFTEMALGLVGRLFLNNLILLNLLIFLSVWLLLKDKKAGLSAVEDRPVMPRPEELSWLAENKTVLFCLSGILGFLLAKGFFNLINPCFGWDSLNYHFTFPVEWLKSGTLHNPPTVCGDPTPTYYPINNCLIYYWLIAPFKNVFLADAGQIPFFLLSFTACFAIARKFKLSKELSFYAAGLFVITPNFFKQIEVGYADIIMAALFMVSLNTLFILNRKFCLKNLALSGISLGLFLGVKTLSVVYSAVLIILFLYALLKNAKGLKMAGYGFLFFMLVVVFGGYGYIRNFITAGNPLFPLDFTLFGIRIFKGVMPKATYLVRWTSEGYNLAKLFFHEGMGIQLFLLIFPAAFLALPLALWKKDKKEFSFPLVYFLLLPLMLYFTFRYFIPQLWTRFLYPYLGAGSVVAVYVLNLLKVPLKAIKIIVVICFLAAMGEMSGHAELILSFAGTITLFFILPKILSAFKEKRVKILVLVLAVPALLIGFSLGQKWYLGHEYERYISYAPYHQGAMKAWKWLNDNTKGERIAYTGWPMPFALYGTNFKNDVYYISVNSVHPAQLHFFPEGNLDWKEYRTDIIDQAAVRDENYRGKADFKQWYKNILKENTDYFFTYLFPEYDYAPMEDGWARSNPKKFKLVFDSRTARIYKVLR